ncbi:hypothetical protein ACLI09_06715 [Flavobacterium sp. RHBU_24]|uniref:hypothetical protein n=1 Tax=Flavobacterium sp. RHBU_24 TaxID=3391185 RepID=UPI003984CA00
MKLHTLKIYSLGIIAAIAATGCSPDEVKSGNAMTQGDPDASFTATTTDGNHYAATAAQDADIQYHTWKVLTPNTTDTETEARGAATMNFTFPTPGTYTIIHRAVGYVAGINTVSQQVVTITTSLIGPNLIQSPNFESAADWATFNTSGTQTVTWTIGSNSATANGGVVDGWSGQGIYQAVELEEGNYIVDMHVESPGASDLMWFQLFIKPVQPVNGTDYGGDPEAILGLNTWAGCATAAFNGMLSQVGCVGSGQNVSIPSAGTYYFVIKTGTGANNGVNNITVSDVSLRKVG